MTIEKIRELNDKFRQSFIGGKVLMTRGVYTLSPAEQIEIVKNVKNFNKFSKENDPYNEHDFGAFDYNGETYFWKIDYYDTDYLQLSPNPADPTVTNRVLTIMLAEEY